MAKETDKPVRELKAPGGPELRLLDRRAFVGFPRLEVSPGLLITDFALQIPDVTFPFNVSGGASRYQKKKLAFGYLELSVDAELVARRVSELAGRISELDEVKLHFRPGYLEGQARLRTGERAALTFKVAFDGDGDRLAVYLYDIRFYGFSATPAPQVSVILSRAVAELGLLPEVELRGASGFNSGVLPALVQLASVSRGYKMPSLDQARLASAEVSGQGLRLRFASGGLPPPAPPDEELLLTLEGARAFADAEALVAQGKLKEAREAYLKLGDAAEAHPFAAERLLSLMVADPQAHELVLDLAATLARRRERSATALWAEAVVRERRGESARAAERYLALCELSRKHQEQAGAFFAAESATRAARDQAPQMAVKALHELLGLRPDHLPSLKALARASDQAQDRAGAIRAYRRLTALARDPADAADAHVHLARLCAQTEDDLAGARLHCEAALRLAPDHPDALYQLGELCHRGGEHLRAIKALDRLREVALGRHEVDRIGRANLLAGQIWESGLGQHENALLRYREAISLLPGEPEPLYFAARAAEHLNKLQEALAGYQQAIELAGPGPRTDEIRRAAHQSHHALARLHRSRLGDPAKAREHLEAALALDPADGVAIEELIPYFRSAGKALELAEACEKAAAIAEEPARRAALWAESGELYRGRLAKPEKAERLLACALEADPKNRAALEGMLALAESRRDGGQLCACLKGLAEIAPEPKDRVRYLRRLAVAARDLAFDLELAARSLIQVLELEPDDLPTLGELCGLQRRRADMPGLALALEARARAAETLGDKRLAATALRELAGVLEARLGRVGEALVSLEKAARLAPDQAVLLDLANLSLRCERPGNARRALEDLLSSLPRHTAPDRVAEIRAKLGKACELVGDRDAAKEHYAAAFPLRRLDDELAARLEALYAETDALPLLTELWAARGQALLGAGRSEEAASLFLRSGLALQEAGDAAGAMARLTAALEADPLGSRSGEVLEAMAGIEQDRGDRLEAAKLWARRALLLPEDSAAARIFFKAATLAVGTPREEGFLAQALVKDPGFLPARVRRSELLFEGDPRAALSDLEVVLAGEQDEALEPSRRSSDGIGPAERGPLTRRAGLAALRAGLPDLARKYLSRYAGQRPDDLEIARELLSLHKKAGAKEALCDLLGHTWPRLSGPEQENALREYAELCLELGRAAAATGALRQIRAAEPDELWAARKLLSLLPSEPGDEASQTERLDLLSALIGEATGDERAELLSRRSALHRDAGRRDAARADLHDAAADSSRPGPLLRELALAWREAGDEPGELAAWQMAVDREPALAAEAAARMLQLAHSRLKAGDAQRAREGFDASVRLPLSSDERCAAFFGLAAAARELSDPSGAATALLEASRHGTPAKRIEALLERAALLESEGNLLGAGGSLEAALALSPRHPEATSGLKRVLRGLEDWAGLAEVLAAEASHQPKPQAAPLYAELGALYAEKLEQRGPAEAAFRRAAALDKSDVAVRRKLAALLVERKEVVEATELLEEASGALPPGEGAALLREGVHLSYQAGERVLALRLARQAQALVPAAGADRELFAELLYLHGAVKEALPLYRELASGLRFEEDPDRAEKLLLRLADLAEQDHEPTLAKNTLRKLLVERPLCSAAVERLAALVEEDDPREAIELLYAHVVGRSASEGTTALLLDLARRARKELGDLELAGKLLDRATETAAEPLPIHQELARLYKEAGRVHDLMAELQTIASLHVEAGETTQAIDVYEEEAALAEASGRVDEALKTLEAMSELSADEGELQQAASFLRRRAELLRDAKLDLPAAAAAFQQAFELYPDLPTALLGAALAQRREDLAAETDWAERMVDLQTAPANKAMAFLQLAKLHLGLSRSQMGEEGVRHGQWGAIPAPDQGEAALREALVLDPSLSLAEALLCGLLEEQGRLADLAGYHEEAALRASDPAKRGRLLMKAAQIYKDRAGKPHQAAAALLAARAASPDDLELTGRAADLLLKVGRESDAAEFDAVVLQSDPFRPAFQRHAAYLEKTGEWQSLAALMLRRAQKESGPDAAHSYLAAAQAFRRGDAGERALLCEDQAFEKAPQDDRAFEALKARFAKDVRRLGEVLLERARAVPAEAKALLRERADRLATAGEALEAAAALDELLEVAPDDVSALIARAELAAEAGGASSAQPYDRRLLRAGGDELPAAVRLKSQLRLGHAALNSGAYKDAAEAFQAVVQLDPEGEKGREALSLLSEVHARNHDAAGLFGTSLALAKGARPDEAEALYRRAAGLFEDPKLAIEALMPLSRLRPSDRGVVDRAVAGLQGLGRHADLLELYQRSAEAIGGPPAAELLLQAASLASDQLDDPEKAKELRRRAGRMDPDNPIALRALADEQRAQGDAKALEQTLSRLAELTKEEDEAALARLELAGLLIARSDDPGARPLLDALLRRGAAGAGYPDALEALEGLLQRVGDDAALGEVLAARAELTSGEERATRLLAAAQAMHRAKEPVKAANLCRTALSAKASVEGHMLHAALWRELEAPDRAADSLIKAAALSPLPAQGPLLLEAAEAFEAAKDFASASELVQKVSREHPALLKPATLGAWFERLGEASLAASLGFAPAMAGGHFERALALADAAKDQPKAQEALWALTLKDGASPNAFRLATELREARDFEALQRLGELCARGGAVDHAYSIFEEVALFGTALPVRQVAVANLARWGQAGRLVEALNAAQSGLERPPELAQLLLDVVEGFAPELKERTLEVGASVLPTRRQALLQELLDLRRKDGRLDDAAETLRRLIAAQDLPRARAALHVQLGELYLSAPDRADRAREAFELALAEDCDSVIAVKSLVTLCDASRDPERFILLAERLGRLAGPAAVEVHREALVGAYEKVGRVADAHRVLSSLPDTPERLARRASLALALGFTGEALHLRERLTEDRAELQEILHGYVKADLVPFAVSLAARLMGSGPLPKATLRLIAERLAPTGQGAALACRLWPELLRGQVADADGWTLYSEALRQVGRTLEAEMVDGFGAALTSSLMKAPRVRVEPLQPAEGALPASPGGLIEVSAESMPRLHHTLRPALDSLGVAGAIWLDPGGGLEAYQVEGGLVVGAGSLAVFGPAELEYLCALAVALGAAGLKLTGLARVEGLEAAAARAFSSVRSSLAASRVLARLDDRVRGADPMLATMGELLPTNEAFRAVALRALELLEAP